MIATANQTLVGWLAKWNTTTVANGDYSLRSIAYDAGGSSQSAPITVTVNN